MRVILIEQLNKPVEYFYENCEKDPTLLERYRFKQLNESIKWAKEFDMEFLIS